MNKYYVDLALMNAHEDCNGLFWSEDCITLTTLESVIHKSVKGVGCLTEVFVRHSGDLRIIAGVFETTDELHDSLMGGYLLLGFKGRVVDSKISKIEHVFVDDFCTVHSDKGLKGFRHELS